MKINFWDLLFITYLFAALVTFGKVYHEAEGNAEMKTGSAGIVSIFWPFYWSTKAWELHYED